MVVATLFFHLKFSVVRSPSFFCGFASVFLRQVFSFATFTSFALCFINKIASNKVYHCLEILCCSSCCFTDSDPFGLVSKQASGFCHKSFLLVPFSFVFLGTYFESLRATVLFHYSEFVPYVAQLLCSVYFPGGLCPRGGGGGVDCYACFSTIFLLQSFINTA